MRHKIRLLPLPLRRILKRAAWAIIGPELCYKRLADVFGVEASMIKRYCEDGSAEFQRFVASLPSEEELLHLLVEYYRTDLETIRTWVKHGPEKWQEAWDSWFPGEEEIIEDKVLRFYAELPLEFQRYAHCFGVIYAYKLRPARVLADIYHVKGNENVLDFGCGGAMYALDLAARGCRVDLLDVRDEERLRWIDWRAKRLGVTYTFLDHDASLAESHYDIVLCLDVLEHLFRPFEAIIKIHRALRKGGKLHLIAPFGSESAGHIQAAVDDWRRNDGEGFLRKHFEHIDSALFVRK